jgi:ParB/RepB/Spo0J family partition protein
MKTPEDSTGGSTELLVSAIVPDPKNRKEHNGDQLRSLADSIKADGLLQPIVVRQIAPGKFMLVAGERRWRAHGLLKRDKIPAIITSTGVQAPTAADVRKRAAENFQREDLTPIEEARLFRELHIEHKIPQAEVAKIAGRGSQSTVANSLRLLELPSAVQQLVQDGKLTRAHGVALARWAKWSKICEAIASWTIKKGLSSRNLEEEELPVSYELVRAGLVAEIDVMGYGRVCYTVPAEMQKDPAFVKHYSTWYCLEPAKWTPEKDRQDKARAAKEASEKKSEAAAVAKGGKTKEQLERAKKLATNKTARLKIQTGLEAVTARLRRGKADDINQAAALVCKKSGGRGGDVRESAELLGIKLPKDFDAYEASDWSKLAVADALRLVAHTIVSQEAAAASRFAGDVPDEIEFMLAKKGGAK